ncbi:MAG: sigma-70 family RNA polymerase sigma factor [Candidatus Omnitrophica bacterium]|nr:sigma-70 family RNA polymerase sigma factor [Candidatus Omnitrophota bacterium]
MPMDERAAINELSLIQRILSGNRDAYAELVRAHQARTLRVCTALLGDAMSAEDAAQDTFFKAYQSLASFRGQSAFSTWLYRIAANHCLDLLRKRQRERTESWDALIEESGEQLHDLLVAPPDPQTVAANTELIQRALAHLTPEYRLILTLREVEGLSYQELAIALHCSLDAVKARLRRARQDLLERVRHFLGAGSV